MIKLNTPKRGTRDYEVWRQGADAEARLRTESMTKDAREIYACVEILAQRGDSGSQIIEWLTFVFTADWSLRRRLRLAWKLVRG